MGCEEARRNLGALAVEGLDREEREEVLRHVSGCPRCRRELEELRETVGVLRSLPAYPDPPPDLRARTISRATGDTPRRGFVSRRWLVLPAVLVLAIAALGWLLLAQRGSSTPVAVVRLEPVSAYRATLAHRDYWGVAKLYPTDRGNRRMELRLHHLGDPGSGWRVYQAWLVSKDGRTSAGTFEAGPGRTVVWLNIPSRTLNYDAVVITVRDGGRPAGDVVLRGRMTRGGNQE